MSILRARNHDAKKAPRTCILYILICFYCYRAGHQSDVSSAV